LHAALIAAAVGNGGVAFEPSLIEEVDGQPFKATGSSACSSRRRPPRCAT